MPPAEVVRSLVKPSADATLGPTQWGERLVGNGPATLMESPALFSVMPNEKRYNECSL